MRERWYVIQSKPKKEGIVCTQLEKSLIPLEVFFPRIMTHVGVRPLFPSYLFVRTVMEDYENSRLLKYTRGVLKILNNEEGPVPVADEVVTTLKSCVGKDDLVEQSRVFSMGQRVRVIRGPLRDLIGILEKPVSDEKRVQVLFRLLKYPLRAVLKFQDLAVVGI